MSGGNSFRSVFLVASCAAAALGCYLVSLRVASERAALEDVETQIVLAERDIRLLQTEIGTRGRLAQLERWNVKVLALSAPSADQFLGGSFELASMVAPERKVDLEAPVVLASAPAEAPKPQVEGVAASDVPQADAGRAAASKNLLHVASLKRELPQDDTVVPVRKPATKAPTTTKAKAAPTKGATPAPAKPVGAKKPAAKSPVATTSPAAKPPAKKTVDKPSRTASKPVTKPVRLAKADPLAPLPEPKSSKTAKDSRAKP